MMRRIVSRISMLLILSLSPGCIELLGQRISWFHDEGKDELRILLCYDGIHNNPERSNAIFRASSDAESDAAKLASELTEFVASGDFMLLDWFGVISRSVIAKQVADESNGPKLREVLDLVLQFEVKPVGHFVDPDHRVGAAQRIVIPNVSGFIGAVNAAFAEAILTESAIPPEWKKTYVRLGAAAKSGHRFVSLDGQAIVFDIPVDDGELLAAKGAAATDLVVELAAKLLPNREHSEQAVQGIANFLRAFSSIHMGWSDGDGHAVCRIGSKTASSVVRIGLGNEYRDNLEKDVERLVPTQLHSQLSNALLEPSSPQDPAIRDWIAFGPKEEIVRGVALETRSSDAVRRNAAIALLKQIAVAEWNGAGAYPALELGPEPLAVAGVVDDWYRDLVWAPLPER